MTKEFQDRTGWLMAVLYGWTAILFIPLLMSTGVNGVVSHLKYPWPLMTTAEQLAMHPARWPVGRTRTRRVA